MTIRPLLDSDWPVVARIYEEGIRSGNATFQTTAPTWSEWDAGHTKSCRLAAEINGEMAGWAAISPVSGRCVYAGVGEVSVYIAEKFRGQGVGLQLLEKLIEASEQNGFWTLQAGIFPENTGSIKIHEKAGFRLIGRRERIGQMNGIWRDTLLLERRSTLIGQ